VALLAVLALTASACSLLPGSSGTGSGQPATKTAAEPTATASSSQPTFIAAADLTKERLLKLFDASNITYTVDDNGDIVTTVGGLKVFAEAMPDKDVLEFYTLYGFTPSASMSQKLALCNRFNDNMLVAKMAIPENDDTTIVISYDIITTGGVAEETITESLSRFATVAQQGLQEYDTDNIVQ
jgi:hypothetical protein